MTPLSPELSDLGDAIHAAVGEELAAAPHVVAAAAPPRRRLRRLRSHPRILTGVVITAVAAPGVAAATGVFNSAQQVAASVPAGTLALLDTEPSCTVVTQGVEYHCTLASLPSDNGGPEPGQWLGTVEPTVDQTKHVNGGCRSLNGAGTEWECYLGEAAVHQKIIGQGFLGQFAPTPGVG
jgi:hypothetical protein